MASEHLAGLLPVLAEGVAGRGEVRPDETIAEVVQVLAPLVARHFEVTRSEKQRADTEVDGDLENGATARPTFDRTAEPGPRAGLDRADEALGDPAELFAETVELLHRRVMATRHVMEMFLGDVRHGL